MNIYEKWQAMMDETGAIEKDTEVGYGHSKYRAVGEAAVLNVVKPLLKKYKLIVFPVDIEAKESVDTVLTSKGEATRAITQLIVTWQIVDTESGEIMEMMTVGNGADSQDKGSGKAMTYAYKVLFQKSLMLFSGEDTDNTHSDEITAKSEQKKVDKTEVQTIKSLMAKIPGSSAESLCKWLGVSMLEEMTGVHYAKAVRFLQGKLADLQEVDEVFPK